MRKTTEVFSFKCILVVAIVNHSSRHSFSILKQLKQIGFRIPVLVSGSGSGFRIAGFRVALTARGGGSWGEGGGLGLHHKLSRYGSKILPLL